MLVKIRKKRENFSPSLFLTFAVSTYQLYKIVKYCSGVASGRTRVRERELVLAGQEVGRTALCSFFSSEATGPRLTEILLSVAAPNLPPSYTLGKFINLKCGMFFCSGKEENVP
jgi:hypothetical protein